MIYYISMLSTTGGKLKISPNKILKNYFKIKRLSKTKNAVIGFGITEKTIEFFLGSKMHEIKYEKKGNTLYRGSFNFENNKFFAQFRIPKDISYSEKNAIIRFGIFNSIVVNSSMAPLYLKPYQNL